MSLQREDTPLHKASANGHEAVVEVLLKAGVDHSIRNWVSIIKLWFMYSSLILLIIHGKKYSS